MVSDFKDNAQISENLTPEQNAQIEQANGSNIDRFSHELSKTEPSFLVIGSTDIKINLIIKQNLDGQRIYDLDALNREMNESSLWKTTIKNHLDGLVVILYDSNNEKHARKMNDCLKSYGLTSVYFWDCNFGIPRFESPTNKITLENSLKSAYSRIYSASIGLEDFETRLEQTKNEPVVSTGFDRLDQLLDGGLYPGLYTFGADTSLGKSTFWLNVAVNISERGRSVLYFSIEMSKYQMTGRMLSRETYHLAQTEPGHAQTGRTLTSFDKMKNLPEPDRQLVEKAKITFKEKAKNLYLFENIGEIYPETIRDAVLMYLSRTGTSHPPVVIVDYIQILRSQNNYIDGNDKLKLDKNLFFFKKLSNEYRIPIVLISSLNRDSYKDFKRITMTSFKESGSVEYTSDVLIGMQLEKLARSGKLTPEQASLELSNDVREIDLIILKNRDGKRDTHSHFIYSTLFNDFKEVPGFNRYPVETDEIGEVYRPKKIGNGDDEIGSLVPG